jgi:hypothetical protein
VGRDHDGDQAFAAIHFQQDGYLNCLR